MLIALLAAGCMVVQDVLGVIMVQAEAANRGWLAGSMDCAGWFVAITTTTISVTSLSGHNTSQKIWVLTLVGIANILGTKLGQVMGKRIMRRDAPEAIGGVPAQVALLAKQVAELQDAREYLEKQVRLIKVVGRFP